jgi:cytoskeletal protein CcmA (bactofilin family)
MWRKEDGKPLGQGDISTGSVHPTTTVGSPGPGAKDSPGAIGMSSKVVACVSQGIRIKGEVTGTEDLFVDGQIEGKLALGNCTLTIGPNATVKADVSAREVVVRGRVNGKVEGSERIQIWHSARVSGDMKAQRISIEEGAELHGKMEAGKPPSKVSDSPVLPGAKKVDAGKSKDATPDLDKPTSGAAVAGAD